MRLLALDTATEACSVALWIDGEVLARFEVAGRSHTQQMLPMVHGLMADAGLKFAQLDGFACGIGPGSFAGVRIGVGFVKGLALSLDRPVVGVSSLAMLAQGAIDAGAERVLASIDARMNEVYFGAYVRDAGGLARELAPARVAAPDAVREDAAGPWIAVGTGWGTYEHVLRGGVRSEITRADGIALPRAEHALKLALPSFAAGAAISADGLAPLYLRDKVALTLEEQVQLRESKI
jgi:tRNA threonylcarbamoyladenosine biosynthesis protein TsaB